MPRRFLRLTAPVASRALLPEDPALALALAQELLEGPRMSNHTFGLWGYHGVCTDGKELTIQATGPAGAGAAIVLGELAGHGLRAGVRLGSCAALSALSPGDGIVLREALARDGPSRQLGAPARFAPDPQLTEALVALGLRPARVATFDLPPGNPGAGAEETDLADAEASDLASASVLARARELGVALACVLVVAESPGSAALSDQELGDRGVELGRSALAALRSPSISSAS